MMKASASSGTVPERNIAAVRTFNRFYTQRIGVLREHLLEGSFPLTPVRVLYELAHWPEPGPRPTATALATGLGLDEGYLSRILRGFEQRGLLRKTVSDGDGRRKSLALTAAGRRAFAPLDARSRAEVRAMLARMAPPEQRHLIDAMNTVATLLGDSREAADHGAPTFCARTVLATSAGSSTVTARCTRRNTATTSTSRPWSRRSPRVSSNASTPGASAAGSRSETARSSAPCFSARKQDRG